MSLYWLRKPRRKTIDTTADCEKVYRLLCGGRELTAEQICKRADLTQARWNAARKELLNRRGTWRMISVGKKPAKYTIMESR
jgi:hypothetical protein